jgi:pyruvate dehydrogenase E1 component beta subunit
MRPIVEVMTVNFSFSIKQCRNLMLRLFMYTGIDSQDGNWRHNIRSWEPLRPCSRINCSFLHEDAQICHAKAPYRPVLRYFLIEYGKEILRKLLRSQAKVEEKEDISIIIYGAAVYKCLEAANELAKIGIEAEVVDLRVLRSWTKPLSWLPFQTHRAIIVEEAWRSVSISAEVSARIMGMTWTLYNDYVVRKSRSPMPII